ncbi:hypothetical protein ACQ3G6_13260 [Allorhizobium undicola]|uniref:hypothetical protein n=1 Tax=Allorhizobium undicola TaxID=78527 RepID=UPI003D34434D
MKFVKIGLLGSASLLALTVPAHAAGAALAIGNFIFSALYTAGVSGVVANFVANAFLPSLLLAGSVASSLANRPGSVKPSDMKSTYSTEESPVRETIGRDRSAGLKFFGMTDGDTRWRVIGHAVGPVDAIEEYYLGNYEVVVDEDTGYVTSPPWPRESGSWAKVETKFGTTDAVAWPALMTAFPDNWTSSHRLLGIFQNLVTFYNPGLEEKKYLSLYQGGTPSLELVYRGSRVYQADQSGQSATDSSTWTWDDNSTWAIIHVMRRDSRLYDPALYNWTRLIETAAKCDALVATKDGNKKRSRLWGTWSYEDKRSDTLQKMLDSSGLEIRLDADGLIYLDMIEDQPTAEIAFTDRDIIEDTWQGGPEAVERPNICRVKYRCQNRDFEISEINMDGIAWAIVEDEVARYGEKYLDVELEYCPDAGQAQRIARRKFLMARADTVSVVTQMVGLAAWGKRFCSIQTEYDDEAQIAWIDPIAFEDSDGKVTLPLTIWPDLPAWNVETDEAAAPEETPTLNYVADIAAPSAPTYAIQTTAPDGTRHLRIPYTVSGSPDTVEANYRSYTDDVPTSWRSMTEASGIAYAVLSSSLLGQQIDARLRVFEDGEGSDFSDVASLTVGLDNGTPNTPTLVSGGTSADGQTAILSVTVRVVDFRVAAVQLLRGGSVVQSYTYVPGGVIGFSESIPLGTSGGNVVWVVRAITTNGNASGGLSFSQFISDNSGGSS